ncbi:MAG: hypothetical protein A3J09_00155 [Candidatus Zambryskibacteria bacterium RIFCSPLOWO2_02_FULL_51_21]|uniref:VTT domain-containing protein n=1 Tax=Candidatus Zambryskibacteria bacterium RIFCSPHIGHO2_02_FULL_43_37 TaxID=1802749 RepID=A0A1G2TI51_9BACT|nr:MAG: hypothetical protein A2723_00155 [Candidatus Zambryskibacteria bacterium RIFCSPHIGHO2_01_FULL_52_18]OHA96873.1 MAG: hypothetical protein A3D49_02055 [Candidatus Zambryskibacteria bacterium RIFCSPHIGHO2_02_FULL_43_37]OHB07068.1 MAG: hypothetical protein A2944_02300 [Candidatus Zambryskibacteria bacterium RIFCSPLOWO2_01_FULL_52_12]OHB10985.1 MAG: hypothetical protein A3J09_00155 [Candidatus Zambryskibacteria bacterium RIFCSPLOWO2_02_FULL_51_21]
MQEALDILKAINSVVLEPNLTSAVVILIFAFANELLVVVPYALILSGQLLFLNEAVTPALLAKLLVFVAVPVGLGSTLGTMAFYGLAYFGGKPAVNKYHKYLHFSWNDVEKVSTRFKGVWYDEIIFLLLRVVPVLPSMPLSLVAGFFRMRFWPYFVLTAVGLIVRMLLTLLLVGVGVGGLSGLMLLIYNN